MTLTTKEEKDLRNLIEKDSKDRPIFLTQEEGSKLFEEIDSLRKENATVVKYSESLIKKYKDDKISQSMEDMLSDISTLQNVNSGLRDFLSTVNMMIQRTTRVPCTHGTQIYSSSSVQVDCEHCEVLEHLVEMINKVEKE